MSVEASKWAWEIDGISATQKLVLLCLADHADELGSNCYPGQTRMAKKTKLSRETVNRAVRELKGKGLIRTVKLPFNSIGAVEVNHYTLNIGGVTDNHRGVQSDAAYVTQDHNPSDAGSQGGVTQDHNPSDVGSHNPSFNREKEPSGEPRESGLNFPDWFDQRLRSEWNDFVAERADRRTPMSARAQTRALARLERLRARGEDPLAVLSLSIERGWDGLFPTKDNPGLSLTWEEVERRAKARAKTGT